MELLSKGFDDFSNVSSELKNFSTINKDLKEFEISLAYIAKNIKNTYADEHELHNTVTLIGKEFKKKADDIEYFKSLNASLIGGSHFLFDLQRSIIDDPKITMGTKKLVNETLFSFFSLPRVII